MRGVASADLNHILSCTDNVWPGIRHGRVFLTGGTGFFGCWLLESFLYANDQLDLRAGITILTRNAAAFREKAPHLAGHQAVTIHEGDVRDFDFPHGEYTHIIHAATETDAARNAADPLSMCDTVVTGTRRVLDFAVARRVKSLLLTSSGAVYGRQPSDVTHIPESHLSGPDVMQSRWAYGESKRMAEMLCCLYAEQKLLAVKVARCFAFVGPYLPLDTHFAIGNFIGDVLSGRSIHIKGDGTPFRSYLYAADLVVWLWSMLERAPSGRAYNVGSDVALSIADLARTVVATLRPEAEVHVAQQAKPGTQPERYVPNVDRANSELGLSVFIPLDEAIRRTAMWHTVTMQDQKPIHPIEVSVS